MDVWQWTPLIALIVLAGLASMPGQVLEAAKVDGATYLQRLRHIVLPMIAGVIVVALLIRSMDAIRYFDIIQNTTNGGPADATKIDPDPALRDGASASSTSATRRRSGCRCWRRRSSSPTCS